MQNILLTANGVLKLGRIEITLHLIISLSIVGSRLWHGSGVYCPALDSGSRHDLV